MTLNEDGKAVEDRTKNQHSRRAISLLPVMRKILEAQLKICTELDTEFLFCTPNGSQVQRDNLRGRVWEPALKKAGISYRPMMQTRHSFATTAFSLGENPLWIAKVMGHSTTRMVIDVYAKYIANQNGTPDGGRLDQAYQ
jgi:integrase